MFWAEAGLPVLTAEFASDSNARDLVTMKGWKVGVPSDSVADSARTDAMLLSDASVIVPVTGLVLVARVTSTEGRVRLT